MKKTKRIATTVIFAALVGYLIGVGLMYYRYDAVQETITQAEQMQQELEKKIEMTKMIWTDDNEDL